MRTASPVDSNQQSPILVALVLYQKETSSGISLSLGSFLRGLEESGLSSKFRLFVYDNSPLPSPLPESIPIPLTSVHDPANGGLVRAYSAALQQAEKEGHEWLLLLDQDTVLDAAYLEAVQLGLQEVAANPRCAALVPKLQSGNKIISPARVLRGGRVLSVEQQFTGIPPWELVALNSGTVLRVSAVRALGGFNPIFWLDYLDHWLFNRLFYSGYSVYVLDAALSHALSVRSMASMPVGRYRNILAAEAAFYKCCKSQSENWIYRFRLLARALKNLLLPDRRKFFLPTLGCLAGQIVRSSSRNSPPK
jgi:GT2 family glycosyltransferase